MDHVFLYSSPKRIAALKTNQKGKALVGFTSGIGYTIDSEYPRRSAAMADMVDTLGLGDFPMVIVSFNAGRDKIDYAKAFPVTDSIWLDIKQLAWPLVMHSAISSDRSFKELCAHFGVKIEKEVEGSSDVLALSEVYWAMMTRYKTSLFGEELIRDIGGGALKQVRGLFGV